jgi:type IV pilus assembly protein PilX
VLIISLILLVVISLLAVTSMRNAGSSESVAGNVRRTELATEAAEIALRFCEEQVLTIMGSSPPPTTTPTPATTPATPIILAPTDPPKWQDNSTSTGWDSKDSPAAVSATLLDKKVNPTGMAKTYQRPPKCMIEMQFPPGGISTNLTRTSSFVITARGFGPEAPPADSARSRPQGSEAWLQSHIQIQ